MLRTLVVALTLLVASAASAHALLPPEQWTPQARIALGQAWVAEADWDADTDHLAISYVLLRRWNDIHERFPAVAFSTVVRAYCSGLELSANPSKLSPRLRWVRQLNETGERPLDWPSKIPWEPFRQRWVKVLERVDAWAAGELPDPCRGLARHFGGTMDAPGKLMEKVECGQTLNTFYRILRVNRIKKKEANDGNSKAGGNTG